MNKDKGEIDTKPVHEKTDRDPFFSDEMDEEWEKIKARRKKRNSVIIKTTSLLLAFSLIVSTLSVWFDIVNLPALRFIKNSNRLSKNEDVKQYKKAVVTVEWDGKKGTGFNISPAGLIVTNAHVVEKATKAVVRFKEDGFYYGDVIANIPEIDLALIHIDGHKLPTLPISYDENWQKWIGEDIIFIGNPLAYTQITNEGTVTGEIQLQNWNTTVMEITAPIYKGNSGSPVINKEGEVIGIIFAAIKNNQTKSGKTIGAAVPSYHIKKMADEVKQKDPE